MKPTLRHRLSDFFFGLVPFVLSIVVIAGIVHIVSVFAMPRLATQDAYTRVSALVPLNRTTVLPDDLRASLPFEDPATVLAACRYDLAQGPLHLTGAVPPDLLMVFSFHARHGQVYYSMTDRGASRGKLDVLVLTQAQLDDVEARDSGDELPQELRIVSPAGVGFVLVRALAEQPGDAPEARRRLAAIGCALDKAPGS